MSSSNLATILKSAREIRKQANQQSIQHIAHLPTHTDIFADPVNKIYIPSPTAMEFHKDDTFVKLIVGPYGSGKSTLCIQDIINRTCQMPIWYEGRRKARVAIVRNTSGELHSTTLKTWLAWFADLGDIRKRQKPYLMYEHIFNDGHGMVELEAIFLALDRPDDVAKVKSLELTFVYLNELSELPANAIAHFKGRINGRYPSKSFCPDPYWSGIIADSNPCDTSHWMYRDFVENPTPSYKLYRQPPGLLKVDGKWVRNPNADNASHLADDYYEKLAEGQKDDFVKVFCLGDWGVVEIGKRVYPEFSSDFHACDHIDALQGEPLYLGVDFGLTPACVVTQLTTRGQLLVLKEYTGEDIGIRNFFEMLVIPSLKKDFPYCPEWKAYCDPAGKNRSEIMEEMSAIGELINLGIRAQAAHTNKIEPRLGAVRFYFNKMIDGKPAFQISKVNCPVLYKGLARDYVYKRLAVAGEEKYKEEPDKNMASHPCDGLGYVALELAADSITRENAEKERLLGNRGVNM